MKRTTVMLPADLKSRATGRARRLGVSLGELIRDSLAERLGRGSGEDVADPLFADDAVFSGKAPKDLAARHDEYLYGAKQ